MGTIQTAILERVRKGQSGRVFIAKDFVDLGSRDAIDQSLSRLARAGEVQRLGRGLYCAPRANTRIGIPVTPDFHEIAKALGRQTGSRVVPSGAAAANLLGLTTQVPAKPVYLTDGRTRQVRVGNAVFRLQHAPPKELPIGSPTSAMVFQALRYIGHHAVDARMIAKLRKALSIDQKRELLRDAQYTTDWITAIIRQVVENKRGGHDHG